MNKIDHPTLQTKRKRRIRSKLFGTAQRPRVTVHRSNKYTYVQVINDESNSTLLSENSLSLTKNQGKAVTGTKIEQAQQIAEAVAADLKKLKVTHLAFDRGSYKYHGRVKAVAMTLRDKGLDL